MTRMTKALKVGLILFAFLSPLIYLYGFVTRELWGHRLFSSLVHPDWTQMPQARKLADGSVEISYTIFRDARGPKMTRTRIISPKSIKATALRQRDINPEQLQVIRDRTVHEQGYMPVVVSTMKDPSTVCPDYDCIVIVGDYPGRVRSSGADLCLIDDKDPKMYRRVVKAVPYGSRETSWLGYAATVIATPIALVADVFVTPAVLAWIALSRPRLVP